MQTKFLKTIVENLINKQASPIIDLLLDKKDVNEFLIAKKLNLTINQTRNILYKLSDNGLVSFIRKKDKKKGWYIYFWTLDNYQSLILLENNLKVDIEKLENELKSRMENRYFVCNICSIEVTEDVALNNNFVCTECEQVYTLSEGKDKVEKVKSEIERLKKDLELVSEEKRIEEEKLILSKSRKIKRAEKKRMKIKKEKAIKRAKEKKKKLKIKKKSKKESNKKKLKVKQRSKKESNKKKLKVKKKSKKRT
jgi:transcription initiation factor TFIIE subunit alpha